MRIDNIAYSFIFLFFYCILWPAFILFLVDLEVKGRADERISEDIQKNLSIVQKINLKCLGTLEHPLAKRLMENTISESKLLLKLYQNFSLHRISARLSSGKLVTIEPSISYLSDFLSTILLQMIADTRKYPVSCIHPSTWLHFGIMP